MPKFFEQANAGTMLKSISDQHIAPIGKLRVDLQGIFDFGYIADETDPAYLGASFTESLTDELWRESINQMADSTFRLPYPKCGFLIRYHETEIMPRSAMMHILKQDEERVTGRVYQYSPDLPSLKGRWCRLPYSYEMVFGAEVELITIGEYPGAELETQNTRNLTSEMMVANAFLQQRGETFDSADPRMKAINAARAKFNSAVPLRLVVASEQKARAHASGLGGGGSVSAHNRRGHWRTLANGRRVWVRDAAIHGGVDEARQYDVNPAPTLQ
ncbi:hypothetical protein OKW76_00370 [Sphingomonas sp. S1-29]|uniref:hypothetical protein n=1 Tax=Sphingomonas sp. S1-29 TaxID=2991074 RepID=UPI00223F5C8F|nr:hypothetical protein [Sphingomonas sp. S1-29]UZK69579.1 hypothetical protein OKW76_00370 [Sphingomonas sp. S1-29]